MNGVHRCFVLITSLSLLGACKPALLNDSSSASKDDESSKQENTGRVLTPLPEITTISSLIVLGFNGDINYDSIEGHVLGFPDNLKLTATSDNRFFIKNPPDGKHSIIITAKSTKSDLVGALLTDVRALNGTKNEILSVNLTATTQLRLRMRDATTDKAISPCSVTFLGTKIKGECTSEGLVSVAGIPEGNYNIEVSSDTYELAVWRDFGLNTTARETEWILTKKTNHVTPSCREILTQQICSQYNGCRWDGWRCQPISDSTNGVISDYLNPYPITGSPYLNGTNSPYPSTPAIAAPGQELTTFCAALDNWQCIVTQGCRFAFYPAFGCIPKQ